MFGEYYILFIVTCILLFTRNRVFRRREGGGQGGRTPGRGGREGRERRNREGGRGGEGGGDGERQRVEKKRASFTE